MGDHILALDCSVVQADEATRQVQCQTHAARQGILPHGSDGMVVRLIRLHVFPCLYAAFFAVPGISDLCTLG